MRLAAVVLGCALAAGPAALAQTAPAAPPAFDSAGWVADLEQVRQAMSSHYANLEWAATEREAPLGALFATGGQRLAAARHEAEAREVFERLERYLGDGHVDFVWPRAGAPGPAAGAPEADTRPPCERLGFRADPRDGGAVATRLPGYRPLDGESGFPAGVVEVDGQTVGVIRIALFSPQAHPTACAAALAELRPAGEPCDEACADRLWTLAADRVTADLSDRLRALKAAGATSLMVDIAGNGGGTEWVEAVARIVTPVPLRSARVGFVRHPHWVEAFADGERRMREAAVGQPAADRARLEGYAAAYAAARAQAEQPCDPAPLFEGQTLDCEWLGRGDLYSTGPMAALDPAIIGKPWAAEVFTPLAFAFEPGVWRGPLVVLVDGATASASEEFAALLQDNQAAIILGAPTVGAGCGHTRGGIDVVLRHSGATLRLPDCARFRADGSNEVAGIDPDVLIGFRQNDGPTRRVKRLAAALPVAIDRAQRQAADR
ncbi:MAG: S41 family peptidase [Brevundimonas sp.]|uniref:S41 family peptidase n=1 Tax=Brevundimonas sp. TaxID=1871086 RepID=UPI00391D71F8